MRLSVPILWKSWSMRRNRPPSECTSAKRTQTTAGTETARE